MTTHRATRTARRRTLFHAGLCLMLTLITAVATAAPAVDVFSPQGSVTDLRQVRVRFSTPMVAFGDPRLPEPFAIDCAAPGRGRWADARNWVYDFTTELPAGRVCHFTLKDTLRDVNGDAFAEHPVFAFDTGGPAIRKSMPYEGDSNIDSDQAFILALDAPADAASVLAHGSCTIANIAEQVPLEILSGEARSAVLAQRRALGYQYFSILWKSGRESIEKVKSEDLQRAEEQLLVVRCQRQLPPDSDVRLVWGAGIATEHGIATVQDQGLAFHTRAAFNVSVECERVNPRAACLPLLPIRVNFSAPVPVASALAVSVVDEGGKRHTPEAIADGSVTVEGLSFAPPFNEHGALKITLPKDFKDDAGRDADNAARFPLDLKLDGYPPLAKFGAEFGILEASAGGVLPVTLRKVETALPGKRIGPLPGHVAQSLKVGDGAAIGAWLRRVEQAMAPAGEWQVDDQGKSSWRESTGTRSVFGANDATQSYTLPNPEGDHSFQVIGIPLTQPGFYVVELASTDLGAALLGRREPRYVATAALVTDLAVHFQWGRETSLVWITRLDNGRPVAGAQIEIADYCSGEKRWSGATDVDGIARVDTTLGTPHGNNYCESWTAAPLIVTARLGEDMSFALSQWHDGIAPSDFSMPVGYGSDATLAHSVLDRTLLRAGETVSMKHFLREHGGQGLRVPSQAHANIEASVVHLGSDERYALPVTFDERGVALSSWSIPASAKLGEYEIRLLSKVDDREQWSATTGKFRVEQFRVPSMRAVLQAPAKPQVNPPELPLDIYVGYLSGGAAAQAQVKLRTQLEPRAVAFKHYSDFTFGGAEIKEGVSNEDEEEGDPFAYYLRQFGAYRGQDSGTAAQAVAVQDIKLDEHGSARVTVPALNAASGARNLVAELEYQDANGERLATATRVPLWPAAIALGIKVEGWAGTRDKLRFHVAALSLKGEPLRDKVVNVKLFQRERSSYRKRLIGGFYAYETTTRVKAIAAHCDGRTDSHGELSCEIAPQASGELVLSARADDGAGNIAVASTTAWVAGDDEWWFKPGNADRIDLLPEQKEYQAGDIARFQVRMPFRHATALVSVEREGVIDSFVTELDGHEPLVEVPIKNNYSPNVYVSVLAVRGRVSWLEAALGTVVRYFKLPWAVDGALPTALVDLGKPAYRLGLARINVGWQPHRLEVDVTPAQSVYKVRDTAHVDITVKRADGTALAPGAEVALAAVDEGLLELAPNDTWDLLKHMMGERSLEVWTSTAQMQVVGKRHYGRKAVPHGGGGGRGAAARERFDTLLAWQGRVTLDAQGHAGVDIPLNDSLSAFRIVAVAHDGLDRFGSGAVSIRTSQDLMLMSGMPPLVRETDSFSATFTLRNASEHSMQVDAQASVQADGQDAQSLPAQTLTLAAGASQEILWQHSAPIDTRALHWQVTANEQGGASASDTLKVSQEVAPAYPVRVYQATLTQLDKAFTLRAALPAGAIAGRGGLEVALRAHLGDGLQGVHEFMGDYAYICLEQTLSRAIALRDRGLFDDVMARLPNYLDRDGLARYFPSDWLEGSDTLTSYILAVASEAGWDIPDASLKPMQNALRRFVAGEIMRDSVLPTTDLGLRKLAAVSALARYGMADAAMLGSISIEPELWPTSGLLDWVDILKRVPNIDDGAAKLTHAAQLLRARLNFQGTVMGFATEREDALWWLMISGDVNAARVILEFLDDGAWREDMPRMVRGALARQEHGHWNTTVANAWGVLAMEKFSAAFESTPVDGATELAFGTERTSMQWAPSNNPGRLEFPWQSNPIDLEVTHRGGGKPWAMIASRAALPLSAPIFTGYTITRTVTPIEQKSAGVWTRGDVARVSLSIDAQSDSGWVVVDDPIPAGASLLGTGLGRDAALATQGEKREGWVHPAFEERRFDAFRAYYSFVPKGRFTVEYTVRLNNPGRFVLPATRVEAMYAPEMFGELPNDAMEVAAP
ncbi:MAG: hypothetical protein IT492_21970 [Gammaproteobacteria bacterium]|nr:hypothetical protein [Gammaproteobacteria bacterium]